MRKTILVIEGSDLVRKYMKKKLGQHGFEVLEARTGFEGLVKLKNSLPDLVLLEYHLPRVNGPEVLEEKSRNKGIADIPVIMFADKADRAKIRSVAKYGVARFFAKPLRVDAFMKAISEILDVEISLDTTPCNIDVHLNEQILFIELAQGLNQEKIELMTYKIVEVLRIYGVTTPRVLIILTGIEPKAEDKEKLLGFFTTVLDATGAPTKAMKLLTTSPFVKELLAKEEKLSKIEIMGNLTEAMDALLGIKVSDFIEEGYTIVRDDMLAAKGDISESIQLSFEGDRGFSIAVVDDDLVTRELVASALGKTGWEVVPYEDGKQFVDSLASRKFDLVLLDLLMPQMDGFTVLARMKADKAQVPVIILSALSEKETVVKAMSFGIRSYLAKPLTPLDIQNKATEILTKSF